MRIERSPLLLLPVLFASCSQPAALPQGTGSEGTSPAVVDLLSFDPVQYTCALYVAVRSAAWEQPMAFGNDMDDTAIHWNMCPSGNMVACAPAPAAHGDSARTGIPWPYATRKF